MATVAEALRLNGELASQLVARAPRWAMYLLVILLGLRAAFLLSQLAGLPSAEPLAAVPPLTTPVRNVVDVPSILRANLFGQSGPPAGSGEAPVTSMSLVLAGVIADTDEKLGFAMIGTSSADIKFYKVGDLVPGGVQLHAVFVDRVLLDRSGTIESLLMPVRTTLPPFTPPPPIVASGSVQVERVQQIMRENPGIIGQVIQRQAVFADGKLRGMRVYPGANPEAFNRLGLKPGDIVTGINGTPLTDQSNSSQVFDSLSSAAEARVTVMRNGTQQELQLNLGEIANEAERLSQAPAPEPAPTGMGDAPPPDSAR